MEIADMFEQGDLVWFLQTCGYGYGYQDRAPAIFVQWTSSRATIDVELQSGGWKRIHVAPRNLEPREAAPARAGEEG